MESMPDGKLGYSEIRSVNENKSMAVLLKVKNEPENTVSTPEDFMAEYYPGNGSIAYEEAMTIRHPILQCAINTRAPSMMRTGKLMLWYA